MGPRQISQEFYSQEQRTLLGFCCFYKDSNNNIQKKYFDIISDHLKQTAYVTIKAFRFLRQNQDFKDITKNVNKYNIWFDTGKYLQLN